MRYITSIHDNWTFFKKEGEAGVPVTLPHTWNAEDGQDGGNDYYRGRCLYARTLRKSEFPGDRQYLEIGAASQTADIYLDGKLLARHEGGYSLFRADLTGLLTDESLLQIFVDNSDSQTVYPQKADFTFYGGLYRGAKVISVPEEHFELIKDGTPGIKVTPCVDLESRTAAVKVESWQNAGAVTYTLEGQSLTAQTENGHAEATFTLSPVHLWNGTEDPFLYTVAASLESGDEVSARFGCRVFQADPQKGFFLNGKSYPLRGVSKHQDRKGNGVAVTSEDLKEDMAIVRELGANTLRLAHYQHPQEFYDLCDENGIVVWAEIPYITMHMPGGRDNTLSQMRELITQCYNHPSIAVWGLSNEITAASAVNDDLLENHRLLNDLCHRMDPTRHTVMADVFMLETDSPILEIPDWNSYNLYFGWYLGEMNQTDEFFDEYHAKFPDRVIGFSEYGADANPALHSSHPEKGDYSEEYQALYLEHMLRMIEERPYLWATHVWNLFDFAADGRDEGGKHGENQKGLVSFDRKLKKDAFYLYKAAWNRNDPFVHLCGSRYVNRAEEETEVKVYSNCGRVELWVDGRLLDSKEGSRVFRFRVPLTGEHVIRAVSGDVSDEIRVRRINEPDSAYRLAGTAPVNNWFDEDIDPAFFSVQDTYGEILADPKAAAIIGQIMAKASAERGDVAEAVKDNPALVRMMSRMTMLSLLKQSGADEESIRQLNRILQTIPKDH